MDTRKLLSSISAWAAEASSCGSQGGPCVPYPCHEDSSANKFMADPQAAAESVRVLERLTPVEMHWKPPTWVPAKGAPPGSEASTGDGKLFGGACETCELEVELRRAGSKWGRATVAGAPRVYAPRFPKVTQHNSWPSEIGFCAERRFNLLVQILFEALRPGYRLRSTLEPNGTQLSNAWRIQ